MDIVPLLARLSRDLSKLSYFHVPGKEPLLPWTVGEVIDRAADSIGDTTAIVSDQHNISKTYTHYKKDADMAFFGISLRKRHVDPGLFGHLSATRIPWSCKKKIIKAYRDATSARMLELNRASVRLWTILLGEGYRNHQRFRLWDTGRRQHFERNWVAVVSPPLYEKAQLLYAASKAGLVMREIICLNSDLIYGFGRTMGVLAATMFGSTIVMPGTEFVPKQILEAIKKYR
ncbi:hypothetical protein HPB47_014480 [Ixodes persulcatus]|uniref:Uncharacterized protein n=1 Tax=Ixodes persulcatus TaxID=34615 RepID=A0AC60QZI4_IXOPE|nr:hypothetical protein HPB47_014480 [Ixodes persulcatus]